MYTHIYVCIRLCTPGPVGRADSSDTCGLPPPGAPFLLSLAFASLRGPGLGFRLSRVSLISLQSERSVHRGRKGALFARSNEQQGNNNNVNSTFAHRGVPRRTSRTGSATRSRPPQYIGNGLIYIEIARFLHNRNGRNRAIEMVGIARFLHNI